MAEELPTAEFAPKGLPVAEFAPKKEGALPVAEFASEPARTPYEPSVSDIASKRQVMMQAGPQPEPPPTIWQDIGRGLLATGEQPGGLGGALLGGALGREPMGPAAESPAARAVAEVGGGLMPPEGLATAAGFPLLPPVAAALVAAKFSFDQAQ